MKGLYLVSTIAAISHGQGRKEINEYPEDFIMLDQVSELPDHLPDNFDWGNINGKSYLTNIKQQHVPRYCGSCWAQATTSVMSDRIKIARDGAWPDINIAPQVLISCEHPDNGCHGGNPITAWKYIKDNRITDETCSIYRAAGHDNGWECSDIVKCRDCNPHEDCFIPDEYYDYTIDKYGGVYGEYAMMLEIYANGPITCGIDATPDLEQNYSGGIYRDTTGAMQTDHDISIVGWGIENGQKFWRIRNSWGTHWGEEGFFRLVRGENNMAIESNCTWAHPIDNWTKPIKHVTTDAERNNKKNNVTNREYPVGPPHLAESLFMQQRP